MLPSFQIQAIAQQLKSAQDQHQPLAPPSLTQAHFDIPSAYAVAQLIHEARIAEGLLPLGRKLGLTNLAHWPQHGVAAPVWAHVYDRSVLHLPSGSARFSLSGLLQPKIEPEIALHLCKVPAPGFDAAAILACVDYIAPAFELVQTHYPNWQFSLADSVANQCMHGALLIGPTVAVAKLGPHAVDALRGFSMALSCDSQLREFGGPANVLGSPLEVVARLVDLLASTHDSSHALCVGEWISTGTLTTAQPALAGQHWKAEFQGVALPSLQLDFIA